MKKIVRLTESDLVRLVKKVINEQSESWYEDVWNEESWDGLMARAKIFLQKQGIDSSDMDEDKIYKNISRLTQSENVRTRHYANKIKSEIIGAFGSPDGEFGYAE